ncbi:isochorismate synthase [Jonesia quinghaiensis]|uniref:isochorismate synthase n=1 Tax=Jonesia quinghaiensis TaxID=262806 RepID=UPI0004147F44|nr:isochorismate synthase [Jonesia quinghaiensis]
MQNNPAPTVADAAHPSAQEPSLLVHTVAIEPLGTATDSLISLLPRTAPLAWVRRGQGIVGWGEVARISTSGPDRFDQAEAWWARIHGKAVIRDDVQQPGSGLVAFGSFAFSYASQDQSVMVIPRVIVGRRGDTWWLTTVTEAGAAAHTSAHVDHLTAHMDHVRRHEPVLSPGEVRFTQGTLSSEQWMEIVADAVNRIRGGELDKIVLARDLIATTEHPLDSRHVLTYLATAYKDCWTFSVDGLVGATPELLVRAEKGLATSRVLAGTIQRTGDDATDTARAGLLARSSKDLEEHEYAVISVADALRPHCTSLNVPEAPFVLHLPNVLHLASDVTGVINPQRHETSLSLAASLHPTAAVCGTPTMKAAHTIADIEHMDRARYAGPVGWLGGDGDGEWGIALRSAQSDPTNPHRMRLFAGCGIVAASSPVDELAETRAKLAPMMSALQAPRP